MASVAAASDGGRLTTTDWQEIRAADARAGGDSVLQTTYLKASNTGDHDHFGHAVAISGDTLVIAAPQEDSGSQDSGAAYVFVRSGGSWAQQALLKASNTGTNDRFGQSVAISGNRIVVGATWEDSNATGVNGNQNSNSSANSGAAYVFVREGGAWSQEAYLKASNTHTADHFGSMVAISGETIVVGAVGEGSTATGVNGDQTIRTAEQAGAAYVFVRADGQWQQEAYIKASNTGENDGFAFGLALSGDTLVVSAPWEDCDATGVDSGVNNNNLPSAGAAYVFVRSEGQWSQEAYLKASNTDIDDQFGWSVAVSGNTVIVGANLEDSNATGVNGDQHNHAGSFTGAAYVFTRGAGGWSQQSYLKASNTGNGDAFGTSVSIAGDLAVIGADHEDSSSTGVDGEPNNDDTENAGAAYVFTRTGQSWRHVAYVKASNTGFRDYFSRRLALDETTLVSPSIYEDSAATGVNGEQADENGDDCGAAYVFEIEVRAALLGDMDCNSVVSVGDIGGFVLALTDPAGYAVSYPECDIDHADVNQNGAVNVADIGAFVALIARI